MTAGDLDSELGVLRSRHDVDNARRQRIGGWSLGIGAFASLISVIMLTRPEDPGPYQPGQGQLEGAIYGLALVTILIGVTFLWKSFSRAGEYFEVRELGLVHVTSRRRRTYPWTEIAYIRVRTRPADVIGHYFGSQYWAAIAVKGRRRKLTFNGLTNRYQALAAALMTNCPPAPRKTVRQRLAWLGLAAASAATFAYLINYVATHPDTERRIDRGFSTEIVHVPGISEAGIVIIVIGFGVTAVLTITGLILFWRRE